ncbi:MULTISPECIES: hypothetical protein [Enterobacterales]|uniref:hypothetical protein n=1 Tax=Enterobacterales TaxID=91347 RepID=UPI00119F4847|nr:MULTISPECIES: hypothetical protein [Enterobacterales]MEB0949534.1 hypothetical protein [Citrobacter sedlakii]
MTLKFYDSPFHVNHNNDVANEMVKKIDLSIMLKDTEHEENIINKDLRNQALSSFEEYEKTGEHLMGKDITDFLRSGKPGNLPECHK